MLLKIIFRLVMDDGELKNNDLQNKGNPHLGLVCAGGSSGFIHGGFNPHAEYDRTGSSFCLCGPSHSPETATIPALPVSGHTGCNGSGDTSINSPGDLLHRFPDKLCPYPYNRGKSQ